MGDARDRLKRAFKELKVRQSDVTKKLKISQSGLSTILTVRTDKISYSFLLSLKAEYALNPEWILEGKELMYLPPNLNAFPKDTADLVKKFEKLPEKYKNKIIYLVTREEEKHQEELAELERQKQLEKQKQEAEGLPHKKTVPVPVLGEVSAGTPIYAEENTSEYIDYDERVVTNKADFFFLKVRGDSMIECRIFDGDYILVQRNIYHNNGSIVIARVEDDAVVKKIRFLKESNEVELIPCNPDYKTLVYPAEKVDVMGVVIARVANEDLNVRMF